MRQPMRPEKSSRYVALAVALALCAGVAQAKDRKWGPHVEVLGGHGSEGTLGRKSLFLPLWQSENQLLFADLRSSIDDDHTITGSFGGGFRSLCDRWVFGGYGYFDVTRSDEFRRDHTFLGGVIGVEAMNNDWDFRINTYIPEDDAKSQPQFSRAFLNDDQVFIEDGIERALYGTDFEVGYRFPFTEKSLFWDTRLFVGGYYFDAKDVDELAGPQLRAESRIYDLPYMPVGSRLTLSAGYRWDDVRHSQGFGELSVRIPFYGFFGGGGKGSADDGGLSRIERRMVDTIVRQTGLPTNHGRSGVSAAYNPFNHELIDTVRYAEWNGTGDGSRNNPDSLQDALDDAGQNGLVIALDTNGSYEGVAPMLVDGQYLVGAGSYSFVTGRQGTNWYRFSVPGERPELELTDNIWLGRNNLISGLDLWSSGDPDYYGITGIDVENFRIDDTRFDNTRGLDIRGFKSVIGVKLEWSNYLDHALYLDYDDTDEKSSVSLSGLNIMYQFGGDTSVFIRAPYVDIDDANLEDVGKLTFESGLLDDAFSTIRFGRVVMDRVGDANTEESFSVQNFQEVELRDWKVEASYQFEFSNNLKLNLNNWDYRDQQGGDASLRFSENESVDIKGLSLFSAGKFSLSKSTNVLIENFLYEQQTGDATSGVFLRRVQNLSLSGFVGRSIQPVRVKGAKNVVFSGIELESINADGPALNFLRVKESLLVENVTLRNSTGILFKKISGPALLRDSFLDNINGTAIETENVTDFNISHVKLKGVGDYGIQLFDNSSVTLDGVSMLGIGNAGVNFAGSDLKISGSLNFVLESNEVCDINSNSIEGDVELNGQSAIAISCRYDF